MHPIYKFKISVPGITSNLLIPTNWQQGYYDNNGNVVFDRNYISSPRFAISGGLAYKLIDTTNAYYDWYVLAFFDANGDFISRSEAGHSITTPSSARAVSVCLAFTSKIFNEGVKWLSFTRTINTFEYYGYLAIEDVHPIYGNSLVKTWAREQGEMFYRAELSGKLRFERNDYALVMSMAFDAKFLLDINISQDAGVTWSSYWNGYFYKTDCEFDEDAQTVLVQAHAEDIYTKVLAGLDNEYDLIKLSPAIQTVEAYKRPMVQTYIAGSDVVGCYLDTLYWEAECEKVINSTLLESTYHFFKAAERTIVEITQQGSITIPDRYVGAVLDEGTPGTTDYVNGDYKFRYIVDSPSSGIRRIRWQILRAADNTILWAAAISQQGTTPPPLIPYSRTLTPVSAEVSGNVIIYMHNIAVWARIVCDVDSIDGTSTVPLPTPDMVQNNRNYTRCLGFNVSDAFIFSTEYSNTPTEWGRYGNQYYVRPTASGGVLRQPVGRKNWNGVSIWYAFGNHTILDYQGRKQFTIEVAYPLHSVIAVLLAQIAPELSHFGTVTYSQFLYGTNPITQNAQKIFITPKTNILNTRYDQPAQSAPITLRSVLDMLRDCYRCYWWIDGDRFRIEHVEYFRKGGSYTQDAAIGIDLTTQTVSRSGKPWGFGRNQYQFNKPEMPERYQFNWMDDVSEFFKGYPIEMISGYVQRGMVEEITIADFTSDIDMMLLNPPAISQDGFALLSTRLVDGEYIISYSYIATSQFLYEMQNGWASFNYLQQYYAYDMPGKYYRINNTNFTAEGVKRLKIQNLKFPVLADPDLTKLVKTEIGNGNIQKISINLSSRMADATLEYDTE